MIKIETVTALISSAANWDVRKPQETERQPHMPFLQLVVTSHFNKLRSQVSKLAPAGCVQRRRSRVSAGSQTTPGVKSLSVMVGNLTRVSAHISQLNVELLFFFTGSCSET